MLSSRMGGRSWTGQCQECGKYTSRLADFFGTSLCSRCVQGDVWS